MLQRVVVGTLAATVMLVIETVLYIIRATEVEKYKGKRERNEEYGRKGLVIPPDPFNRRVPPKAPVLNHKIKTQ